MRIKKDRSAYDRQYRAEHREQRRGYERQYRLDHKDHINELSRARTAGNPTERLERETGYADVPSVRMAIFELLGGAKCVRCGFDDVRALQLDHIDGNGKTDRKKYKGSFAMYGHYLDTGAAGLQVLCANCNWIKRHENGENGGRPLGYLPPVNLIQGGFYPCGTMPRSI